MALIIVYTSIKVQKFKTGKIDSESRIQINQSINPFTALSRYSRVSQCSHKEETYWNNHWIIMSRMSFLPLNL